MRAFGRVPVVNAQELFEALARLRGTARVPVGEGAIIESVEVHGIELGRARAPDERGLRAAWRERQRDGHKPLLLVADDVERSGRVRALGPLRSDGQVRVVRADALLRVLERLPSESIRPIRVLEDELRRLDAAHDEGSRARMGEPRYFPDEDAIRRAEFRRTTPGQRVAEAISISRTATKIAAAGERMRER